MNGAREDMINGSLMQRNAGKFGRVELTDPSQFAHLGLRLSDSAMQEIQQLEEASSSAEQRLGMFRVG